jgi:tRNA-dihydrouridine synthase A
MIGREAYHNPWSLREMDAQLLDSDLDISLSARMEVWRALMQYVIHARCENKTHPFATLRHALGLFNGLSGARRWRQLLSDPRGLGAMSDAQLLDLEAPRATRPLLAEID